MKDVNDKIELNCSKRCEIVPWPRTIIDVCFLENDFWYVTDIEKVFIYEE